jgi:hypothetical protein
MGAYLRSNGRPGTVRDVVNAVPQMEGVRYAHAWWGVPDLVVCVGASGDRKLNRLLIEKIQKLAGMERTGTHIVVE